MYHVCWKSWPGPYLPLYQIRSCNPYKPGHYLSFPEYPSRERLFWKAPFRLEKSHLLLSPQPPLFRMYPEQKQHVPVPLLSRKPFAPCCSQDRTAPLQYVPNRMPLHFFNISIQKPFESAIDRINLHSHREPLSHSLPEPLRSCPMHLRHWSIFRSSS